MPVSRGTSPAQSSAYSEDEFVDAHEGHDAGSTASQAVDLTDTTSVPTTTFLQIATMPTTGGPSPTTSLTPAADLPTGSSATPSPPCPAPLNLNLVYTPSEGRTPMATAPTSPTFPRTMTPTTPTADIPHAPAADDKPRLRGNGVPSRPSSSSSVPTSRLVSATMARAYAMAADSPTESEEVEVVEASSFANLEVDVPEFANLTPSGDDEWVSFVRAQLVRLFPDFHDAEGHPAERAEGDVEEEEEGVEPAEPSFRSELLAMRTEIGVLRGIVAELSENQESQESQEEAESAPDAALEPLELDPSAMGLSLAIVRSLDASRSGLRPDSEVFVYDNLCALLAATVSSTLVPVTSSAPDSPPAPAPASPVLPSPHAAHLQLDAHEEMEKARDVSITPEVGAPPKARVKRCEAEEMCDEELQEVEEMAGEAQLLVS
ncbi:hypothetical protein CspHIS471_0201640 [Cutaneotrichosporon sp. HIS471]|nr:hypothetical protein CspHIS471_0201640 [Cutaneotrichosporon sp. HIS471]